MRVKRLVKTLYVLSFVALTACAGWKPYAVVGAGWKMEPTSQELLVDGDNPTATIEVGYENKHGDSLAWCHISHWFSGWPFSGKEFQLDEICYKRKFGGYK